MKEVDTVWLVLEDSILFGEHILGFFYTRKEAREWIKQTIIEFEKECLIFKAVKFVKK